MHAFTVGDRVRVRDLPTTSYHKDKVGTVTQVWRVGPGTNALLVYRVRLDEGATGDVNFSPHELEPATPATP
jgi:hypothetical protein